MAVTITNQFAGAEVLVADVIATADADVAAVVPHGFGTAPLRITLTPLLPNFYLSAPEVGLVDGTNINLVMQNAVGSGDADAQIRVIAQLNPDVDR